MKKTRSQDVFIPGAMPESTYITRKTKTGFTYEERLEQALSVNGYMTFISGPSKIGKTVLCEKVIGLNNLIEVSGADFSQERNMWAEIGAKAGMPIEATNISRDVCENSMSESGGSYVITKESVINYFKENNYVLLVDDFHYAKDSTQMFIAQQFKDAIRKGFKVIVASLPHRSDDAIRTNPDLQGRISIIDIAAWTKDELKEIPRKGFSELGINISEKCIDKLAQESISSPQLMQLICLNICTLENIDKCETSEISIHDIDKLETAFRFSTSNLDYEKVAKAIRQGKNPRGKSRKKYKTSKFGELDLYGLILEAIAIDPPIVSVDFSDLMKRIQSLIIGTEFPTTRSLKEYLDNLQEVLDIKDRSYEVVEWKDNTLYVLESLFLFYLRWGRM